MKTMHYKISETKILKISFIVFVVTIFFSTLFVRAETLSIKGDKVNLRTGPGIDYSVKWEYGDGFPVQVIEKKGDWRKVKDFENDTGWVYKSFLSSSLFAIVKANKDSDQKINIRKGPGTDNKIIGKACYGVVFKILRNKSGWVEVQHESGLIGWVSSHLLWGY
jgi:SH3-like domain-containing protein